MVFSHKRIKSHGNKWLVLPPSPEEKAAEQGMASPPDPLTFSSLYNGIAFIGQGEILHRSWFSGGL